MRISLASVALAGVLAACGGDDSNFDRPPGSGDGGLDAGASSGGTGGGRGGQGGRSTGGSSNAGGSSSGGSGDASVGTGGARDGGPSEAGSDGGVGGNDAGTEAGSGGNGADGGLDGGGEAGTGGVGTGGATSGGAVGSGGSTSGGAVGSGGATSGGAVGSGGATSGGAAGSGGAPGTGGSGGAPACTGNPNPTATVECGSDAECCASGRICGQFVAGTPTRAYCRAPLPAGGSLGTTCTGGFTGNAQCETGLCPTALGYCSALCGADAECGDADLLCRPYTVNGTPFGICAESCTGDASCGAGRICLIRSSSAMTDRIDRYCVTAPATGSPPGTSTTNPSTCDHGQTLIVGPAQFCTAPCDVDTDCPTAVPDCLYVDFTTPGSNTIVSMGLCSR